MKLVILGEVKSPSYIEYESVPHWYMITDTDYRLGDQIKTTTEQQMAYGCPKIMEVYQVHTYDSIEDYQFSDIDEVLESMGYDSSELLEIYNHE